MLNKSSVITVFVGCKIVFDRMDEILQVIRQLDNDKTWVS
jgi:hypothetical protein